MRPYKILLLIFHFLAFTGKSQEISFSLDSIYKLPGSTYEKLDSYYTLFELHKKSDNLTQLGFDAHQLAKWVHKEKKWDTAIEIAEIAYQAREKATPFDAESLKRSYYNYANFNKRKGNHAIAIRYFKKMIAVKGSDFFNGRAYALLGQSYEKIGDLYQAVENQLHAFVDFEAKKQKKYIVSNHINLAVTYKNIRTNKSSQKAIKHLLIADSLIHTIQNPDIRDLYAIHNNLGGIYFDSSYLQDYDKAVSHFKKALTIAKEMEYDRNLGQINYNLGVSSIKNDSEIANTYFHKALTYAKKESSLYPKIYTGLGMNAYANKKYLLAQEYYKKAFSHYFNTDIPDTQWLPQKTHLTTLNDKALFLELLKRKMEAWLAHAKENENDFAYEQIIKTAVTSDQLIDIMMNDNLSYASKLLWRSIISEIYIFGLEASYKLNRHEDAFYFMEKNKALLLTQDVTKKKITIPEEILEQEKKFENEIINLQNQFQNIQKSQKDSLFAILLSKKNNLYHYKDSLSQAYPKYFSSNTLPKILSLSEMKLKDDEIIINYTMAEKVLGVLPDAYGMIMSNTQNRVFKLKDIRALLDNIYNLRKRLNKPFKTFDDIKNYQKVSYQLYSTLIPLEIRKELKNKKVTIVTDHILGTIPFEALVTSIDSGAYLIEECEINYAYSLSFLKENATVTRNATLDFLGLAPVNFLDNLTDLQNSEEEINNANKYYDGSLFVKENATKENFIKEAYKYKILHLATHADASDSIAPWIAFHNTKLAATELNTITNHAEMVILSACNTSLGKVQRGEGVMSLARGFFKSGANTVIPSLWNTNDKTTATITTDFYKNLSEGKTKSQALRIAKLNYLKSNSDAEASPYYWAPLILIGDTGTLPSESNNLTYILITITALLLLFLVFWIRKHRKPE